MKKKPAPKKTAAAAIKGRQPIVAAVVAPAALPKISTEATSEFTYQEPLATRDEKLRAVANTMNSAKTKEHPEGRKLIVTAEEAGNPYVLRRPTGIIELDVHLAGGFPAGGCCMLSGADNVGKSWLLYKTMAMQQRLFGDATRLAVALSEGSLPYDQMLRAGMLVRIPDEILEQWQEQRRIRHVPLFTLEQLQYFKRQLGEIYVIRGATGEEILTGILNFVETNAVSIIGLDSVSGLQPAANAAKDLDENLKRAAHANMMTQFFSKYIPITTGLSGVNQTSLIMLQQLRANQDRANAPAHMQQWIPDAVVSGARSAKHYKLIDIMLKEAKPIKEGNQETGRYTIGKVIRWDFEKGKAGTHDNLQGEYSYFYSIPGVDNAGDLITAGIRRGIIQKKGSKVFVCQLDTGAVLEDLTAPSEKAFRKMIESDFDFEMAIRQEILAHTQIQCLYR